MSESSSPAPPTASPSPSGLAPELEPAHIVWNDGHKARLLEASADRVLVDSTCPAPPGSRLEGKVQGTAGEPEIFKMKVHSSRRLPSGLFRVEGRPIDLSRGLRDHIALLCKEG